MQSKIYLAALAAACLAFSWQPAMAQDDEDQSFHDQCVDAIAANSDDPEALVQAGLNRSGAELVVKVHENIELDFANLVLMKQYLDNLELLKPVLAGKKNTYALDILNKTTANLRAQMDKLREHLRDLSNRVIYWASIKCSRKENTGHFEEPSPVSIGIGVGVDAGGSDGDHHRHHHHERSGPHSGCGPH